MKKKVRFILNGESVSVEVAPNERLLDVIRNKFLLTGTKEGCGYGECGACTVLVDGKAVNSCLVLAQSMDGKKVVTIEGLKGEDGKLHPIQSAFLEKGAVQCGFCTPGMIMSAKALLEENPTPSEEEIKTAIAGNICRCTGYTKIVKAISSAAKAINQGGEDKNDE